MGTPSWIVTLVTQTCLCVALFFAFNVGQRQVKPSVPNRAGNGRSPLDLYFISVRGGFRPLQQQTHLLRQMEKVAKIYNAKFVVNISELGEDDPLMCNGTGQFPYLKVPWYSTKDSKGQGGYMKQIKMPCGKTIDIVILDTKLLWDVSNGTKNDQMDWLVRILESSSNNWCIVAGFHSMAACDDSDQMKTNKNFGPLHNIFLKFRVDAYLSGQECANHGHKAGGPCISNSRLMRMEHEIVDGFLLYRVSSLEMVSYSVSLTGNVMHRHTIHRTGQGGPVNM